MMRGDLLRVGKSKQTHELRNRVRGIRRQGREPNAGRLDHCLDHLLPASLMELRRLIIL